VKVVIVEDEVLLAWSLTTMVEDLGHEVVGTCRTEAKAVAMALDLRPDVVLMDMRLAGDGSGLDAAHAIRRTIDVPIIFCTAYADKASVQREVGLLTNAALIGKPVDEVLFAACLEAIASPPPTSPARQAIAA
jgi:CheY-like chemotaxis protein